MSNILIVGGGFAGLWAALSAARARHDAGTDGPSITLVSPGNDLVIRPRLYEADPGRMRVPLAQSLHPVGVEHLQARVCDIDTGTASVTTLSPSGTASSLAYDRLVLATGSQLRRPHIPGAKHLHDVDTMQSACALEDHLQRLSSAAPTAASLTAVVVGAGFTGLEVATELAGRLRALASTTGREDLVRIVLVERSDLIGPELGPGPRPVIEGALASLGIQTLLGQTVSALDASTVWLSSGQELPAATVVWTAGMTASPLTTQIPAERDRLDRLVVDDHLRVAGVPDVFAAGDTAAARASAEQVVTQSCQHAIPLGKAAGYNAAADLLGMPLEGFTPNPYVTCLDLGPSGAVFTTGWERSVQMTGAEAKQRKQQINQEWIYPPTGDAEEILRRAHPSISTREAVS